jgi:hypothetical protein
MIGALYSRACGQNSVKENQTSSASERFALSLCLARAQALKLATPLRPHVLPPRLLLPPPPRFGFDCDGVICRRKQIGVTSLSCARDCGQNCIEVAQDHVTSIAVALQTAPDRQFDASDCR